MRVENYYQPKTLTEALQLLEQNEDVKILAGGTDLNIALHERKVRPKTIVDISRIPELKEIAYEDGILRIGSMCTFSEIEKHPLVNEKCPMLVSAVSQVGSTQIRNLGTVGGNLANAATAADSVPALMAMDAKAVIMSARVKKELSVTDIPTGLNQTCLEKNELIVCFFVKPTTGLFADFEKIGRRKALAISRINMGMVLDLDQSKIYRAAIAYGAVGKTAYRMKELEEYLSGKELTEDLIEKSCELTENIITKVLNGRSTTPYKKKIGSAVLRRGLEKAMGGMA